MRPYNFHIREQNPHWSILTIKNLLENAKSQVCSSFIIYAALEARNMIERIEFEILVMSLHNSLDLEWSDLIEEYKGIQKLNSKYKVLRYRYQTFTEAFANVIISDFSLKPFEFKKAENIQAKLSQYIHTYTRIPEDLLYESEFMQSGVNLLEETVSFFENMFTVYEQDYIFGILDFSTLTNGFDVEFKNWLNCVDEDVEALKERLRTIADSKSANEITN